jgi:hypothetical protein
MSWLLWLVVTIILILIIVRQWQRYRHSTILSQISRSPHYGVTDTDITKGEYIRRRVWRTVAGSIANCQWIEQKLPRVPSLPPSPVISEQWGIATDCTCAALVFHFSFFLSSIIFTHHL